MVAKVAKKADNGWGEPRIVMRHYNNRDAARHVATKAGELARGTPHWLGRATHGPPLQHRPYQERSSIPRQWIELRFFITTRHAASLPSSRYGIA